MCAKMPFETRRAAKAHARRVAKSFLQGRQAKLYPYACPTCGLWHLTSQNPQEQRRRGKRRDQ